MAELRSHLQDILPLRSSLVTNVSISVECLVGGGMYNLSAHLSQQNVPKEAEKYQSRENPTFKEKH